MLFFFQKSNSYFECASTSVFKVYKFKANIYLFKVNNRNIKKKGVECVQHQQKRHQKDVVVSWRRAVTATTTKKTLSLLKEKWIQLLKINQYIYTQLNPEKSFAIEMILVELEFHYPLKWMMSYFCKYW